MTFMVHPAHGATDVSPSEVATLEKNGWTVSTHEAEMARKGKGPVMTVDGPEPKKRMGRPSKAKE